MKLILLSMIPLLAIVIQASSAEVSISKETRFSISAPRPHYQESTVSNYQPVDVSAARDGGRLSFGGIFTPQGPALQTITRLSADGQPLWKSPIGDSNPPNFYLDSTEGTNGDSVVLMRNAFALPVLSVHDRDGNLKLFRNLGGPEGFSYDNVKMASVRTGYVLVGDRYRGERSGRNVVVRKLSPDFETEWETVTPLLTDGGSVIYDAIINDVKPTQDGGFIYSATGFLVKCRSDGTTEWVKGFGGGCNGPCYYSQPRGLLPLRNGEYLAYYYFYDRFGTIYWPSLPYYGGYDIRLVRIATNGVQLWERSFGGIQHEMKPFVVQTEDGGFILGAETTSDSISGNKGVVGVGTWILKLNSNGVKETEVVLPGSYWKLLPSRNGYELIGWGDMTNCCSTFVSVDFNALHRVKITATSRNDLPFNVDTSPDLKTWTPRVFGFSGELNLFENLSEPQKFYRVYEAIQ